MGVGKTTVGRVLAAAARAASCVDTDALIEARTGRTVREIFDADGEAAFRARDRGAVEALGDRRSRA